VKTRENAMDLGVEGRGKFKEKERQHRTLGNICKRKETLSQKPQERGHKRMKKGQLPMTFPIEKS